MRKQFSLRLPAEGSVACVALLCCALGKHAEATADCVCKGQDPSCAPHCPCKTPTGYCQDWDDPASQTCDAANRPSRCPVCTTGTANCFTQQIYLSPGCTGPPNYTVNLPANGKCAVYPGAILGGGPGSSPTNPVWVSTVTCDLATRTLHGHGGGTGCDGNVVVKAAATQEKFDGSCVHHSIPVNGKPLSFYVTTTGACVPPAVSAPLNPIKVGAFTDTFHQAESAAVVRVLQSRGYNATLKVYGHTEAFDKFWSGETDIMPSVWLPYGHSQFIQGEGKIFNVDYVTLGVTSEEGAFFWAASKAAVEAGISSIDDLADPSKTAGFNFSICGAPEDTGASRAAEQIISQLNSERKKSNAAAPNFVYVPSFEQNVNNLIANAKSTSKKFVSALWLPWWGYKTFVVSKDMTRLNDGTIGTQAFGPSNRGTTLTTPKFLKSGRLDSETLGVLASMFVGNLAISDMDELIHFNGSTPLEAAAVNEAIEPNSYWFQLYQVTNTSVADLPHCNLPSAWTTGGAIASYVLGATLLASGIFAFIGWRRHTTLWTKYKMGRSTRMKGAGIEMNSNPGMDSETGVGSTPNPASGSANPL